MAYYQTLPPSAPLTEDMEELEARRTWTHVANPCCCLPETPSLCACLDTMVCFNRDTTWFLSNFLCCQPCAFGTVAEVADVGGFWECGGGLLLASAFDAIVSPHCCTSTIYILALRRRLVAKYGIDETPLASLLRAYCCSSCSVAQMILEVEEREHGESGAIGRWQPLGDDPRGASYSCGVWAPRLALQSPAAPEVMVVEARSDVTTNLLQPNDGDIKKANVMEGGVKI